MAKHSLGWIGAGGRMGFAMAKRLARGGSRRQRLQPHAQQRSSRSRSSARKSSTRSRELTRVRHRVHDGIRVRDLIAVCLGPRRPAHRRGSPKLMVDCSSVSRKRLRKCARKRRSSASAMLAAPVSGNAKVVAAGQTHDRRVRARARRSTRAAVSRGARHRRHVRRRGRARADGEDLPQPAARRRRAVARGGHGARRERRRAARTRSSSSSTTASWARSSRATRRRRS